MAAPAQAVSRQVVDLPGPGATEALAGAIAALARPGDVIALFGDLGAGKTVFARAFVNARRAARGLAAEAVPSPTFTLVQIYDLPDGSVWHFDLYRLGAPEEVYELAFDEALADGIALIEWPARLGPLLPAERLDVRLDHAGAGADGRRAALVGHGGWAARLDALDPAGLDAADG